MARKWEDLSEKEKDNIREKFREKNEREEQKRLKELEKFWNEFKTKSS